MKARARLAPLRAGLALCTALVLCACAREQSRRAAPADPTEALRADRRIAELLAGCEQGSFYDRDLSDLVPVLLQRLERGPPDALKRAKEELGQLGDQAFPALSNTFHVYYSDQVHSGHLENLVDALAFNAAAPAHDLLLESLRHPQESVRSKALDGLARLAHPTDFDFLVERLAIETREIRRQSVAAIFTSDRTRAELLFLDFLERGVERDIWLSAAPLLAATESSESAQRCNQLFGGLDLLLAAHLAAAAARHGHTEGREHLRAELRAPDASRRMTAASALSIAGLVDELGPALLEDTSVEVRSIAAAAFRTAELTPERRAWLRTALNDESQQVQGEALAALCEHGDEEAHARALAQLDGPSAPLQSALLALRSSLQRDPELARTALERLLQRHALEEHRPLQQRTATFKALGQMPRREAAEFLHRLGVEAGEERLESLRAHDWLMIQAANTGLEGRGYLAEALQTETDALRRIDLIDALGTARDELARTVLMRVVEFEAQTPFERLLAARTLIRVGPSWEIAPRLKRVAFAMQSAQDVEARAALQCLLWQWY